MKNKINKFFSIFSGRPKDVTFTESIMIIPFILGWSISIGLMYYACKTGNFVFGLFGLVFAWQTGWGMSIDRFCKSEKHKLKNLKQDAEDINNKETQK